MGKLLNAKEMGEQLVRDFVQCAPDERIKLADGYAAHVEAYAMAKVVEHLEMAQKIQKDYPDEECREIFASVIRELKTGKSVVGSTEGVTGKLAV